MMAALLGSACSQQPQSGEYASTVVNADGTVTFNLRNEKARQVQVDVQFAGRHDMQKDVKSGLWTVTLGPAAPDMYPYCFVVDGVSVMDPQCKEWFPNEGFKNSLLDMTDHAVTSIVYRPDAQHGTVEYVQYYSEAIEGYNNAVVYLPPSYLTDDGGARRYPVFYLISGTTDTWDVYYKVGKVNYILDFLIAKGEAEEMIVVMPYGNPAKLSDASEMMGRMDLFGRDLTGSLMPYVEGHYRTLADRDHRAIGGFSRGGNQGLLNGLTNLDKFAYLCSYSSFTSTDLPYVYDHAQETNAKIRLLWAGVGTDDFLYGNARDYTEFLDRKSIRCVKEYTDDKFGHTWMNARYFLDKTLRLLFRPEAAEEAMANAQPTKAKTGEEKEFTPGVMARLFPKPIVSPEVSGTMVTFRCKAPDAVEVMIEGEMLSKPQAMERDSDGIWSVSLNVAPEIYCYNFVIDGMQVCDAQNMYLAPDYGFKRSVLNMPDAAYMPNQMLCEYTPVRIAELGEGLCREITVTPAACTDDSPVLYLVACPQDGNTYASWIDIAHANVMLDQMIASGECKPCRLVITEQKKGGNANELNAADYATWRDARAALKNMLTTL